MSKFDELLKQPLPSQRGNDDTTVTESEENKDDVQETTEENNPEDVKESEVEVEVKDDDDDDDEDETAPEGGDDDDFNPDEMSDAELEELDKKLTGETMDEIVGDDSEETLTPEEEIEADDMMQTAATSLLINDELNAEEKAQLLSNEEEVNTIINEGFLRESDINILSDNEGLVEEKNYNRPMIIRLDAASKKKQLYALAINVSAAARNDPDYRKLKKVLKLRKILKAKLERKYRTEATKRMRVYFKRLTKSASPTLNRIAAKN